VLLERFERIMATPVGVHVAVPPGQEAQAQVAIEGCLAWLREVEQRLTRFVADSELCRLNAAAGAWQPVSILLFTVVQQSVAAAEASSGLFDPTLLPVLEALGYDRDFKEIANRELENAPRLDVQTVACGRWREIELDSAGMRIRLPAGARLDLGGIAKGWAADVALDRYFSSLPNVLIDVGGDVRARGGLKEGEPWAIGIGDPRGGDGSIEEQCAAVLTLGRGGLATSGATMRWWRRGGELQHHLIDPRTGRPARLWIDAEGARGEGEEDSLIATATALAPTAAQAEVAAKVALLRGYPQALQMVEAEWRRERALTADGCVRGEALLLILGSGRVVCSEHLRVYLATVGGGGDLWLD
jgi:FAD:protein FMN transferase